MKRHDLLLALLLDEGEMDLHLSLCLKSMRIFIVVKFNCSKLELNSKLGISNGDPYSTTNCLKQVNTRKGKWVLSQRDKMKVG